MNKKVIKRNQTIAKAVALFFVLSSILSVLILFI